MCGIFAAFNAAGKFTDEQLSEAVLKVSHRGPDNLGQFSDSGCFLGHTRLSIVGIDKSGNQPFHFDHLSMSFNGEVFNYIELREELSGLGYSFQTHSDTEVVLKAFHKWGPEAFARFNGMWALAILDRESRRLVVCRDRFGQKPLFTMRAKGALFFASEFQQLAFLSDKEPDLRLIQEFLMEGTYEGEGRTFFKAIQEFPKAHYCIVEPDGTVSSHRYWDYWGGAVRPSDPASFAEFEALLKDAVKLRLRADVPFGVLLSGGVDSTVIAAYSRELAGPETPIPAFTYSSGDGADETHYARSVAGKLDIDLHVREQEQEPKDYRDRLRQLVKHMGRGHSSPAIVSVDYLYESVAKGGIRVALDGQGADELLAGYKNYFVLVIPWFLVRGKFRQAAKCLADQFRFGFMLSVILFLRNVLPPSLRKVLRWAYGYERFFARYAPPRASAVVEMRPHGPRNGNALNRYLIWHHNLGLENLLYYGDIVSMKNSVENRSPFMDHRLVDFVFSRDEKLKLHDGIDKYALRTLPLYERFRQELDRDKIGFSSDIKPATKAYMIEELRVSPILEWPIFTQKLKTFLLEGGLATSKYERFLFRLYQVHLWNDLFKARAA